MGERGTRLIEWFSPDPRGILPLTGFHVPARLGRTLRAGRFEIRIDTAFATVMEHCAERDDTWISDVILESYQALHAEGEAHSVECWQADENGKRRLVGGLYGVGFDRVFCGESMFSCVPDASKVALAWLVAALRRCGAELLDCQFITPHLASLGAVEISQRRYVALLRAAQPPYSGEGVETGARAGDAGAEGEALGEADGDGEALALPAGFAALLAEAEGSASSPGNFIAQSLTQTS
jgi:leucyl/phenylalanyl-tRNA--protein transferase